MGVQSLGGRVGSGNRSGVQYRDDGETSRGSQAKAAKLRIHQGSRVHSGIKIWEN